MTSTHSFQRSRERCEEREEGESCVESGLLGAPQNEAGVGVVVVVVVGDADADDAPPAPKWTTPTQAKKEEGMTGGGGTRSLFASFALCSPSKHSTVLYYSGIRIFVPPNLMQKSV